ncbi:TRAP transporter small permease [Membranihabitans maritimus]|uniref:TRAP transporter small permease n=1 Tax=Membranihabitans maritimus TaxID=2904244 RepID=UPI001F1CE5ED|nr:TRAP transporter small permease [Membranihabitans maritimus]
MITVMNKTVERILIGIFIIMTFSVTWQVLSRYIFNFSASFTEELARFCLMWLAILGAAYMTGQREHISIDYFFNKFSHKQQKKLDYFIEILILLFSLAVLVIGGAYLMYMTFYLDQKSPALQIPLGIIYSILPISGILIIIYTIDHLKKISNSKNPTHES